MFARNFSVICFFNFFLSLLPVLLYSADWNMEPAEAWEAWGIQLANWIMVPTAWEEPEATEIFGNEDPIDKAAQELDDGFQNMETKIDNNPIHAFEEEAREFKVDIDTMKMKIRKYPPSIRPLGEGQWFITVPKLVAMGPYHHGQHQLKQAEKAKHVAAYHCIMESAHSVQEMYDASPQPHTMPAASTTRMSWQVSAMATSYL
jgi:hypothetical protein